MESKIEKDINDIDEDHRELGESIEDAYKETDDNGDKAVNDIAEDHREEGESMEDLKKQIADLISENARLRKERDEAHNAFLSGGKDIKETTRLEEIRKDME